MSQISKKTLRLNLKRSVLWRVAILRRCVGSIWHQILGCWIGKSIRYRQLLNSGGHLPTSHRPSPPQTTAIDVVTGQMASSYGGDGYVSDERTSACGESESDLVALKISLLGDNQIGKTSFLAKYVGKEENQEQLQTTGINQMDKILCVGGARISYSIWEVGGDAYCLGDVNSRAPIPAACKDSVAMLFMFDLTSRCTLNSVINWYQQARKYNQTAIPVMVGSKFDDFVQLPIDLQWTIASQARTYARAINATLFFSSASYNINVNKIFKFITAKLFNLPWTLERNLTIGEPIIDF